MSVVVTDLERDGSRGTCAKQQRQQLHSPSPLRERLRGAGPRQPAGGPAREDAGARLRALGLEPRAPVHEHGAGARQQVALPAAPETQRQQRKNGLLVQCGQ